MKKTLFALFLAVMLSFSVSAAFERVNTYTDNFSDVKESSWYAENVKTAYELGFMNGKSQSLFEPDGHMTVAEGITLASRIHASHNGVDIENYQKTRDAVRFDFENLDNVSFNYSQGTVENGILTLTCSVRSNGNYDPGVYLDNLSLDAKNYSKMVVRMKRDKLDNPDPSAYRNETVEVFFLTDGDALMRQEKCVTKRLPSQDLSEWFEIEIELSVNAMWKDNIRRIRFDPTNNNGVYYIDYIYFTKSDNVKAEKWYLKYIDYAVDYGIMQENAFGSDDYDRNITRAELCYLLAASLPEEYFEPINDIRAIPDVDKNDYYADILLMLYKAGVVLGSDEKGTFNMDSDIKRSEVAAIVTRVAVPEYRLRKNIDAVWDHEFFAHDYEFDEECFERLEYEAESVEVVNGALVLKAKERVASALKYDPKIVDLSASINASDYSVMRIRMKADFIGEVTNTDCDIFFMHEDDKLFTEVDSYHPDLFENSYVDAAGWYIIELNMYKAKNWKGKITALRFDPSNNDGVYTVDYIRFIRDLSSEVISDEELEKNYISRRVFPDETFENGFFVNTAGTRLTGQRELSVEGVWNYNNSSEAPLWEIGPWWTDYNFLENRDTSTDKYTLADKQGIKSLKYDPEEKSLTFTLNADKVYNGQPHNKGELWPHLIIIHDLYNDDYSLVPEERKPELDLSADKVYAEMDIKLISCMDSELKEGELLSNFLVFFYFAHKDIPGMHTYFGLRPVGFNQDTDRQYGWHNDSHSIMKIYTMTMRDLYGGIENSLWREDGNLITGEWRKIRVDITPHIQNMIRLCNQENVYGREITVSDMWISGVNAGYEIRGNYRMEVEMKNLNLVCYDKIE